jgi:hypothetical protein
MPRARFWMFCWFVFFHRSFVLVWFGSRRPLNPLGSQCPIIARFWDNGDAVRLERFTILTTISPAILCCNGVDHATVVDIRALPSFFDYPYKLQIHFVWFGLVWLLIKLTKRTLNFVLNDLERFELAHVFRFS